MALSSSQQFSGLFGAQHLKVHKSLPPKAAGMGRGAETPPACTQTFFVEPGRVHGSRLSSSRFFLSLL